MSKRKGSADVLVEVDESKKSKSEDPPDAEDQSMDTEKSEPYLQIIITGPERCGRSSLICSYLQQLLPPKRTSKFEFLSKQYLHIHPETEKVLMIWDLDARPEFSEYRSQSYEEADVALLCFDAKVPEHYKDPSVHPDRLKTMIQPWITELNSSKAKCIPIVLVGLQAELWDTDKSRYYTEAEMQRVQNEFPNIVQWRVLSAKIDRYKTKELFTLAVNCVQQPKAKEMFTRIHNEPPTRRWLL